VKEFDSHTVPFEEAGGHVAWVFGAAAGWPVERRRRVAEVVVRHMWDAVDVAEDPEGHLLELSTGMDISGRRTEDIPPGDLSRALARSPSWAWRRSSWPAPGTRPSASPTAWRRSSWPAASPPGSPPTRWIADTAPGRPPTQRLLSPLPGGSR